MLQISVYCSDTFSEILLVLHFVAGPFGGQGPRFIKLPEPPAVATPLETAVAYIKRCRGSVIGRPIYATAPSTGMRRNNKTAFGGERCDQISDGGSAAAVPTEICQQQQPGLLPADSRPPPANTAAALQLR